MKILKKAILVAMSTLALTFVLPATSAFAINTTPCGPRTDFVRLLLDTLNSYCFANPGAMAVNINGVVQWTSGNNKATLNYEYDGRYYTWTLEKWQFSRLLVPVRVYEVRIW